MKHIFYMLIILPMLWKLLAIASPKKCQDFIKRTKDTEVDKYTGSQKAVSFLMLGYTCWVLLGFVSFQWPLFLVILILSFIPKPHFIVRWIDAVLTFALLIFIFMNAYHFHIDVWSWILKYLRS